MLIQPMRTSRLTILALTATAAAALLPTTAQAGPNRFDTGLDDHRLLTNTAQIVNHTRNLGTRFYRINLGWAGTAPAAPADPANPASSAYNFSTTDQLVQTAVANGLIPYITITGAPQWAQQGTPPKSANAGATAWRPDPAAYAEFAKAAAARYSGNFTPSGAGLPLPRVTHWQAWNEPNLSIFLAPTSSDLYRALLNGFHDAVKSVQPDALVISAGLAPVRSSSAAEYPKAMAKELLCVKEGKGGFVRRPACTPARFDIFSVHPYSLRAKPNQRAAYEGNMFVADVVDIGKMLERAQKLKTVSPGAKQLWSTEFAWITNPPNKSVGDAPGLAGVRTAVALFKLWHAGVSQVTWHQLTRVPQTPSSITIDGGELLDTNGRAKPTYDALRFPFYVQTRGKRNRLGYLWGRAPFGNANKVLIRRYARGHSYRTVYRIKPNANGVFTLRFKNRSKRAGTYYAVQRGVESLPLHSRQAFE